MTPPVPEVRKGGDPMLSLVVDLAVSLSVCLGL